MVLIWTLNAFSAPIDTLRIETLPPAPELVSGTIFVAPDGNDDTGDGSIDNPYQTVHMALGQADSGDVINLREGHYYEPEGVRFRRAGITLQSHPNEWAVIETPIDDENNASIAVYMDTNAWNTILRRLEIIGGYYYGISTETRWDWGDPKDRTGCSNILIEDCVVHDTGRDCIKIKPNCNNVTIRRCEIYNSGRQYPPGETDGNAEGIDNVNGDFMLVQDCHIHDIFSTGVYFKGGAIGGVVERCCIENCGAAGVLVGFDTSPEFFDLEFNPDYYENIYGIVRNCLVVNTRYAGIGLYAAKGARILNNTIINAGQQGHAALYFGVTFQDWEPYAGRPACTDIYLYNNLMYIPQNSDALAVAIRYADELGGLSGLEGMPFMDHNLYYHENDTARFNDTRPGMELDNATFEQWQVHISNDDNSIEADPLLNTQYQPDPMGPATHIGMFHELVSYDLEQTLRSIPYDIGAYQVSEQTGIASKTRQPNNFNLSIYPNPAQDYMTVSWQVREQSNIELVLYNILGQKIATLVRDTCTPGSRQLRYNTSNLPDGIYFIRSNTGEVHCLTVAK